VAAVSCLTDTPLRRSHLGRFTSLVVEREADLSHNGALRDSMQLQIEISIGKCRQWLLDHKIPGRYAVVALRRRRGGGPKPDGAASTAGD